MFVLSFFSSVYAQDTNKVQILDIYDKPISGAHLQFKCLQCKNLNVKLLRTGLDGKVKNPFLDITEVYISCLGYKSKFDTLFFNRSKNIVLKYDAVDINEVVVTAQAGVNPLLLLDTIILEA